MKKKRVMKIIMLMIVIVLSAVAIGSEVNFFDMTIVELMNVRVGAGVDFDEGISVDSTDDYRSLSPAIVTSLDSEF